MNIHQLYHPFLKYFRTRRMRQFQTRFEVTSKTRILDVGGTPFNWSLLSERPNLLFANICPVGGKQISQVIADGRYQPFKNDAFDIVYSNSVIEHLGTFDNQKLFAAECMRVGSRYYIQTPNKWFPIEPHYITPFIHWLPLQIRKYLLRNLTIWGLITRPTPQQCEQRLQEIYLLAAVDMKQLFPQAIIWRERLLGLTKSLIAVKTD